MNIIIKSFTLSFGVAGRMILPVLAVFVASSVIFGLMNGISGGLVSYISGPITATCITLLGIRAALSLIGDHDQIGYEVLSLYSVIYGIFMLVATGAAVAFSDLTALVYADWQLGQGFALDSLLNAEKSLQFAFAYHALSAKAVVGLVVYTAVYAVMAVPLASAARATGRGAMSAGFFNGFGRSFIPLFIIFAISFFLQFFFNFLTALYAVFPLLLSVVSLVLTQSLPDFELNIILRGLAASAGLLWLHSWIWAASAVALLKNEQTIKHKPDAAPASDVAPAPNMRALRKARE